MQQACSTNTILFSPPVFTSTKRLYSTFINGNSGQVLTQPHLDLFATTSKYPLHFEICKKAFPDHFGCQCTTTASIRKRMKYRNVYIHHLLFASSSHLGIKQRLHFGLLTFSEIIELRHKHDYYYIFQKKSTFN